MNNKNLFWKHWLRLDYKIIGFKHSWIKTVERIVHKWRHAKMSHIPLKNFSNNVRHVKHFRQSPISKTEIICGRLIIPSLNPNFNIFFSFSMIQTWIFWPWIRLDPSFEDWPTTSHAKLLPSRFAMHKVKFFLVPLVISCRVCSNTSNQWGVRKFSEFSLLELWLWWLDLVILVYLLFWIISGCWEVQVLLNYFTGILCEIDIRLPLRN